MPSTLKTYCYWEMMSNSNMLPRILTKACNVQTTHLWLVLGPSCKWALLSWVFPEHHSMCLPVSCDTTQPAIQIDGRLTRHHIMQNSNCGILNSKTFVQKFSRSINHLDSIPEKKDTSTSLPPLLILQIYLTVLSSSFRTVPVCHHFAALNDVSELPVHQLRHPLFGELDYFVVGHWKKQKNIGLQFLARGLSISHEICRISWNPWSQPPPCIHQTEEFCWNTCFYNFGWIS